MPNTDDFWQYAEEALLSALSAKSNDDRKNLLELEDLDASSSTGAPAAG